MMKIQTYDRDLGWIHSTMTADWCARITLRGYRRSYPAERHRLVEVAGDGTVTVIIDENTPVWAD